MQTHSTAAGARRRLHTSLSFVTDSTEQGRQGQRRGEVFLWIIGSSIRLLRESSEFALKFRHFGEFLPRFPQGEIGERRACHLGF